MATNNLSYVFLLLYLQPTATPTPPVPHFGMDYQVRISYKKVPYNFIIKVSPTHSSTISPKNNQLVIFDEYHHKVGASPTDFHFPLIVFLTNFLYKDNPQSWRGSSISLVKVQRSITLSYRHPSLHYWIPGVYLHQTKL